MGRFSSLVLVFPLLVACSSYATRVVEVNTICRQTQNPSFCLSLLNSKSGGADLVSLAQYTIDVVRANVTNTITLIKSLIARSASDSKARAHYNQCLIFFGSDEGALSRVEYIEERLRARDYSGVNQAASAVSTYVNDCVSGESPSDPPFPDRSLLPRYASVINQVVQIILIISNYLLNN